MHTQRLRIAILALLSTARWMPAAQDSNASLRFVGAGHEYEYNLRRILAGGQPITLFLYDSNLEINSQMVTESELPTQIQGFSVTSGAYGSIPLMGIQRLCGLNAGCIVAILAQIPYEFRGGGPEASERPRFLTVHKDGVPLSAPLPFLPFNVNVHMLRSGEILSFRDANSKAAGNFAKHPDGTWVTAENPARPGEILTLLAIGLALAPDSPRPVTGRQSGQGHSAVVGIRHDFGVNLPAQPITRGDGVTGLPVPGLISAELQPGSFGVFRVAIRVPAEIPPNTSACGGPVLSNYTVTLGYPTSLVAGTIEDGAPLCVAAGQQDERSPAAGR